MINEKELALYTPVQDMDEFGLHWTRLYQDIGTRVSSDLIPWSVFPQLSAALQSEINDADYNRPHINGMKWKTAHKLCHELGGRMLTLPELAQYTRHRTLNYFLQDRMEWIDATYKFLPTQRKFVYSNHCLNKGALQPKQWNCLGEASGASSGWDFVTWCITATEIGLPTRSGGTLSVTRAMNGCVTAFSASSSEAKGCTIERNLSPDFHSFRTGVRLVKDD